jgi:hypothetical protein
LRGTYRVDLRLLGNHDHDFVVAGSPEVERLILQAGEVSATETSHVVATLSRACALPIGTVSAQLPATIANRSAARRRQADLT